MQRIMETIFDIFYLITVITLGVKMIRNAKSDQLKTFGLMAVLLGCGDAFHLIPRVYGLNTAGLSAIPEALGFGKFVTSITMTIFYVLLYKFIQKRYKYKNKNVDIAVYALAGIRIALCLFPQNDWLSAAAPVSWGVYRNIPFAILGVIITVLFYQNATKKKDKFFKYMWIAIIVSFACYIPVVLYAHIYPLAGMLMIPKTCAYLWMVFMGYNLFKAEKCK